MTVRLTLGILDPSSEYAELFVPSPEARRATGGRPPTLFMVGTPASRTQRGMFANGRLMRPVHPDWRQSCPACGGAARSTTRRSTAARTTGRPAGPATSTPQLPWGTIIFWVIVIWLIAKGCSALQDVGREDPPAAGTEQTETTPARAPASPPSSAADPLVGDWKGRGTLLFKTDSIIIGENPFRFKLTLSIDTPLAAKGERVGRYKFVYTSISSPTRPCVGTLTLLNRAASSYVLKEREVSNRSECGAGSVDRIAVDGDRLRLRSVMPDEDGGLQIVKARLLRQNECVDVDESC